MYMDNGGRHALREIHPVLSEPDVAAAMLLRPGAARREGDHPFWIVGVTL